MDSSPPLRVAAVGLGWVTTHRHIPSLKRCLQARLVGVIDHEAGRSDRVAHELGVRSATVEKAEDVPWLNEVDAVTVGAPPGAHYDLARSYLEAGKHVLVEKPMAMTVGEAKELSALASERNRILAVVHNFQFTRSIKQAKRMIEGGQLGELREIWGIQLSNPRRRLPVWYEQLPLGLFYDESPHFFYLLRLLAGHELQFRSIYVDPGQGGRATPKKITALLGAGNLAVQIDMHFEAPVSEWHIVLLGTKCAVGIDLFRDLLVIVPNDNSHLGRDILRTSAAAGFGHLMGTLKSGLGTVTGRLTYGNDEVMRRFCLACQGEVEAISGISASDGIAVVSMQHTVIAGVR